MNLVPIEQIQHRIYFVRGYKVMLDYDLATLYAVTTSSLNLAVRRNIKRFPEDFMFQLTREESRSLLLQIEIAKKRGGRHIPPHAFTEHGVSMLSNVLRSDRAIHANISIMRAFSRLRVLLATHQDLARKLEQLEKKYDAQFKVVFDAIRKLMSPPKPSPKLQVRGFRID